MDRQNNGWTSLAPCQRMDWRSETAVEATIVETVEPEASPRGWRAACRVAGIVFDGLTFGLVCLMGLIVLQGSDAWIVPCILAAYGAAKVLQAIAEPAP